MTPYNRVLVLIGGSTLIASLSIGVIFVQTDAASVKLQADEAAAHNLQTLGDQLLTAGHEQREALDEYLLSADPRPLARYRLAVADAALTAQRLGTSTGNLGGLEAALAGVVTENDDWQARVAAPAIAAVQSGSDAAVKAAIQTEIVDQEPAQAAATQFVAQVDATVNEIGARSAALNKLRIEATASGVAMELVAAGLSLWFVRRFGLTVSRDARWRVRRSAERIQIMASLRTLRTQPSPESTAAMVAEAMVLLPGVDVAGVYECTADGGLRALAIAGLVDFPIQTGGFLPTDHAARIRELSAAGSWAERVIPPLEPSAYFERLTALGIKSRAFAPIQVDGEVVAVIGIATTDEDLGRHLIEDLPAVGEFASVAEAILAPALVARRSHADKRDRVGATIAAGAFRPVFQPIIDLATGTTVGYEALTRFDDGCRPDVMFATALECGLGIELETVTIDAAVRAARRLPPGAWLSINVSPLLLADVQTLASVLGGESRPITLEITEHDAITAYAPLRDAVARLGVQLAVDDAGAGVANFNHLVELRPNFVKIDVGLVRGVDTDLGRQAVVAGFVHFAATAGCVVIAEGIETEAERTTVTELGVRLGQGFLIARPADVETWAKASMSIAELARNREPSGSLPKATEGRSRVTTILAAR